MKTKFIRNVSNSKVELYVGTELKVILPGETIEVPINFTYPKGIGIQTL